MLVFLAATGAFLGLCWKFFDFTMDDAFIAFRYAENLAEHGALTWNVGRDPVEGYTSFLWIVLDSFAISAGWDPPLFSKIVATLAALATLALVFTADHLALERAVPLRAKAAFTAALSLSPAFAVITVQGLETSFAALLLLVSALLSLRLLRSPSPGLLASWWLAAFLGGWVRPDTFAFNAPVFVTIALLYYRRCRHAFHSLILATLPFLVAGLAYTTWRIWYFGHPLPNPAYIKSGALSRGLPYTGRFLASVLAPYLALAGLYASKRSDLELAPILPTLVGCGTFLAYLAHVDPIQGYLWRFGFPMAPPALFAGLYASAGADGEAETGWVETLLIVVGVAWPMQTWVLANETVRTGSPHDRAAVGRALEGLDGRLYTSEAGALAYYSGWTVVDDLGLNSEAIAHGTPRLDVLREFQPDLVGMAARSPIGPSHPRWGRILPHLRRERYVAVAATRKTPEISHLYFVDPNSDICEPVVARLTSLDSVTHVPPEKLVPDSLGVEVAASPDADTVCER